MVELIDRWETRQTTIWGRYGSSWPKTDERIMEARGTFEPNRSTLRSKFFKLFCNNTFRIIPILFEIWKFTKKKYFFQLYIYKERLKRFVSRFFKKYLFIQNIDRRTKKQDVISYRELSFFCLFNFYLFVCFLLKNTFGLL